MRASAAVPRTSPKCARSDWSGIIDEQLHPERLSDAAVRARLARFETLALDSSTIAERYYAPLLRERRNNRQDAAAAPVTGAVAGSDDMDPAERARLRELRQNGRIVLDELGQQKVLRAVYSPRQLEEVLVDFWFNHFNVFAGKGPVRGYLTEYERDAIRPHVLGRFRDLLGAVARSPAMLFYLDNWQSVDPQAAEEQVRQRRPRGLNENYARELMELHTLGVDGGYTQADVVEVARAFTGWTIRGPRQGGGYAFEGRRHAKGPMTVLGTTIDAGGEGDGEAVLDLLAAHPATATFIATKLTRRFVADDPPPALVARAAATFTRSRGDLRAVVRTILTSPEFLSAGGAARQGEDTVRVRGQRLAGDASRGGRRLPRWCSRCGRWGCRSTSLSRRPATPTPPTAWVNTGALVSRMNFAVDLTANRVRGVRVDLPSAVGASDAAAARTWAMRHLLRGQASAATSSTLARGTDRADDRRAVARIPGVPAPLKYSVSASFYSPRQAPPGRRPGTAPGHRPGQTSGEHMISRRVLLRDGGLALLSLGFAPAFVARAAAAGTNRRKLLVTIFQRGAADGLNVVVPFGERDYYTARPTIAIAQPGGGREGAALDLDGFFGLHPRLAPLLPLWQQRSLAIVHACGSHDPTRSHFDAQDYMESGTPGVKSTADGWLNRVLRAERRPERRAGGQADRNGFPDGVRDERPGRRPGRELASPFRAVALAAQLPRTLQGTAPALAMTDVNRFGVRGGTGTQASFEAEYAAAADRVLQRTGRDAFDAMRQLDAAAPGRYQPENGAVYPRSAYGQALKQIAQLAKADVGLEIAFAESTQWDHHANEGAATGQLANRLDDFAQGIAALAADLGSRMQDVVILTMSEFGRAVAENGNRGTDHGHANAMFLVGGPVQGGKVYGRWPGLAPAQRHDGRDLAVTTDFRAVFAEVAIRHLGVRDAGAIFPGFNVDPQRFPGVLRAQA